MRDALHILGLFVVFAFLALQFPEGVMLAEKGSAERAPFAEFVTLSPDAHAVYLDAARTSWQVKNEARSRPTIGRLDADVPLLSELLPPPSLSLASLPPPDAVPLPPPDPETYALIPPTRGADLPAFAVRVLRAETDRPPEAPAATPAFGRAEMLSTENSRILKEIMQ